MAKELAEKGESAMLTKHLKGLGAVALDETSTSSNPPGVISAATTVVKEIKEEVVIKQEIKTEVVIKQEIKVKEEPKEELDDNKEQLDDSEVSITKCTVPPSGSVPPVAAPAMRRMPPPRLAVDQAAGA